MKSHGGITISGQVEIIHNMCMIIHNMCMWWKFGNSISRNDLQFHVNASIRLIDKELIKIKRKPDLISENVTEDSKDILEHVLPVKFRMDFVIDNFKFKYAGKNAALHKFLTDTSILSIITKEEDAKLNAAGLGSKMPYEYYDEESKLYNNIFARYEKVGIVVKDN